MQLLVTTKNIIIHLCTLLLLLVGAIAIFSSTYTAQTVSEGKGTINKQLIFILIGVFIYFIIQKFDYNYLKFSLVTLPIYLVLLFMLVYVLFFTDEVRGTNRWISLGFINIQPSEYAKIVLVIINSLIITIPKNVISNYINKLPAFFKSLSKLDNDLLKLILSAIFNIPIIILVFLQPSLGNTIIIIFIWLSMFFFTSNNIIRLTAIIMSTTLGIFSVVNYGDSLLSRYSFNINGLSVNLAVIIVSIVLLISLAKLARTKLLVIIIAFSVGMLALSGLTYIWNNKITNYQKIRVESFLNPDSSNNSDRWQVNQSKIAIGSGRITGEGLLHGSQSKLKLLPFAYTDFIFASISEEFGFAGSMFLLSIYITLLLSLLSASSSSNDAFGSSIILGLFFMLLIHIFVNVGMNIGLLPVTGIPLPLVSYGGSSVMVNLISLGLVQNIISKNEGFDIKNRLVITSERLK